MSFVRKFDINDLINHLSKKRRIFHSEADFQHALAWEIHKRYRKCIIRLEYKPYHIDDRFYVDVWVQLKKVYIAIELKYKTRRLEAIVSKEEYKLRNQSAQDCGRYDFLKDIQRLEKITAAKNGIKGYAVFITNDSLYWEPAKKAKTVDSDFRLHNNRQIGGSLKWSKHATIGTKRGREKQIRLNKIYKLSWNDYSNLGGKKSFHKFRYLLVKV